MVTLKDIALEAGVSEMTVSNVINGKHKKVSAQTIEKINELIKKYNYVPNLNARSLASKSSKLIAIILSNSNSLCNYFTDPYLSELFGEIETLVRSKGYYTIIRSVASEELLDVADILKTWNVDGAIFLTHQEQQTISTILENTPCPSVFIDSYADDESDAMTVSINDYKGGYIATKYLIQNGHKKIAFAGSYNESNRIIAERYRGYRAALKEAGIVYRDEFCIITDTLYEDGLALGRRIANHEFDITAVFTTADILAIGLINGAKCNGCIVPNDISVIGFDGLQISELVTPQLTTILQNVRHKAEATVQLLFDAIEHNDIVNKNIVLDVELAPRQTCNYITQQA